MFVQLLDKFYSLSMEIEKHDLYSADYKLNSEH